MAGARVAVPAHAVREIVRDAAARLAAAGSETPRLDAELLLAATLGCDRARLALDAGREVLGTARIRFEQLLARRMSGEPVAYIVGVKEFRRIALKVDPRVLIPRPETELLVEVGTSLPHDASVVDVGTGSGAIALALKDERPDLVVTATDIDPAALQLARENAARLALDVRFVHGDLLDGVGDTFDAVLANLPYVAQGSSELAPGVGLYEPRSALLAGADGLAVIRRLVGMVASVPLVGLEVGFDQAERVEALLRAQGFARVERLRDLAGHERVVVGRR
jgi:release factor glutamine methyltransferase